VQSDTNFKENFGRACCLFCLLSAIRTSNLTGLYVEIKCQLDAKDEFFIADLIACSTCFGHFYAHHAAVVLCIVCV
jgi:hypothetical protein